MPKISRIEKKIREQIAEIEQVLLLAKERVTDLEARLSALKEILVDEEEDVSVNN